MSATQQTQTEHTQTQTEHTQTQQTTHAATNVAEIVERYRVAEARLHRRRQSACGPSATDRQALAFVYERADAGEPCSAGQLAEHLQITSASTTAVIDRLEGVGLVTRQRHPEDRRRLSVVPVDRRVDPDKIDPLSERIATLAVELPDDRAAIVRDFLERLVGIVDGECSEPADGWSSVAR
jgi:DNA-binding MarR family transcriptional regulator